MNDKENNLLQEAAVPIDDVAGAKQIEGIPKEKPLSRVNRVLSEEDLKSAGVRKMLLGQLDEYEQCKIDLNEVRNNFHSKDKESAVLKEKIRNLTAFDWLYSALLTIGSILIGCYTSNPKEGKIIILLLGIISLGISFSIRVYRSHEN